MRSGATLKHLQAFWLSMLKGLVLRVCLVGSASAMGWFVNLLMEIGADHYPTFIRVVLTASVLLIIALIWVFMTLWFILKVGLIRTQMLESIKRLRLMINKY